MGYKVVLGELKGVGEAELRRLDFQCETFGIFFP